LYILIFQLLDKRWEDTDFGSNDSKHTPNIICY